MYQMKRSCMEMKLQYKKYKQHVIGVDLEEEYFCDHCMYLAQRVKRLQNGKGTINGDTVLVHCEECEKVYWKER